MDTKTIFNYFNLLKSDNFSLLYHGMFRDEFTEKIISLSEGNIDQEQDTTTIRNRISFLIAESFQNIVRHGEIDDDKKRNVNEFGIFSIRSVGNIYYISSANIVDNQNIQDISTKLAQINELGKEDLKKLYLEILSNDRLTDKGGAGLGLIQMAYKSGNKLEFDFEKVDDKVSFFYLQIKLKSQKKAEVDNSEFYIDSLKELNSSMISKNVYLAYKGNFAQDNVLILLKIIERNLQVNQFEHVTFKSQFFNILTELLQNISKHAFSVGNERDGIFTLGKFDDKNNISTGNYVKNSEIAKMRQIIENLNNSDKDKLKNMYLEKLKKGIIDDKGNAGLGFIEIARESSGEINFDITPIDEEISFLTISVNI
ncbi:MAG: SiaB family protein kinase [Bacteroidales bacterium]|nr:SiaB family protein kinase [Bacteroidales bacterium]